MPGPRNHPGGFGVFANLPIPSDTEAAPGELAYALDVLSAPVPPPERRGATGPDDSGSGALPGAA